MKKVVLMALCFLLGVTIISSVKTVNIKEHNHKLQNEIKGNEMNNYSLKKEITEREERIEALKQANKDKWEELTIWKNTESKIQKALEE